MSAALSLLVALSAAPERAALEYTRGPGAERCPDRDGVVRLVTTQLGFDPFVDAAQAPKTLRASVQGKRGGLVGRVELQSAAGARLGERVLESPATDCRELMSALVLAISVAIDPASAAVKVTPSPVPPPATPMVPAPVRELVVVPTSSPERPKRWQLSAGAFVTYGDTPAALPGPWVEARWRPSWFSLGGVVAAGLPMRASFELGQVTASKVMGAVAPCVHVSVVSGCVALAAGTLTLSGERVDDARTTTLFFSTISARLGVDVPLGEWLVLRATAEAGTPLTRYTASVEGVEVWRAPLGFVAGALGLGVRL